MFSAPPARTPKHLSIIGFNAIQVKKVRGKLADFVWIGVAGLWFLRVRMGFETQKGRSNVDFGSEEGVLKPTNGLRDALFCSPKRP
jgi:hypothetical protein